MSPTGTEWFWNTLVAPFPFFWAKERPKLFGKIISIFLLFSAASETLE